MACFLDDLVEPGSSMQDLFDGLDVSGINRYIDVAYTSPSGLLQCRTYKFGRMYDTSGRHFIVSFLRFQYRTGEARFEHLANV